MTVQGGRLVGVPALTLRVWAVNGKCVLVPAALLQRGASCAVTEHHTPRTPVPKAQSHTDGSGTLRQPQSHQALFPLPEYEGRSCFL